MALAVPGWTLAQQAPPAEPPAAGPKWYETIEIHGLVDTYYQAAFDQTQSVPNTLRLFDATNGFQLSYAKVSVLLPPSAIGFRLDVGLGQTASILDGVAATSLPTTGYGIGNVVVQQAYLSLKFPGNILLDGGRFVTQVGAEVIEAKDNWLYSHSILFDFAIPFTHIGVRATVPIRSVEGLSLMASLLNGWDNPPGPVGAKKTGHVSAIYSGPQSTTAVLNILYGYVNEAHADARLLIDAVLGRAFGPLSLNLNFDWGHEGGSNYYGFSLMGRYSLLGDVLRLQARGEYFSDVDALAIGVPDGRFYEGTAGISVPLGNNAEMRLEVRHDHSNHDVFKGGLAGGQTTIEVAGLAWF